MLPSLYERWVVELLGEGCPQERHATCASCAMCIPSHKAPTGHLAQYRGDVKCCSYVPTLWNFLVGSALGDGDGATARGRASVEARLSAGIGVSPLGIRAADAHALIYRETSANLFGRSSALLCPHFDGTRADACSIWSHRNAVCATYFCKHEKGKTGHAFWLALRDLLSLVEKHLSVWSAVAVGVPVSSLGAPLLASFITRAGSTDPLSPGEAASAQPDWPAEWNSERSRFYKETSRLVSSLTWQDVAAIGGAEVELAVLRLRLAHEQLSARPLPQRLRVTQCTPVRLPDRSLAVLGYSPTDIPRVSDQQLSALQAFNGSRETADILAPEQVQESGLSEPVVRRLLDFGILVEAQPELLAD